MQPPLHKHFLSPKENKMQQIHTNKEIKCQIV